MDTSNDGLPLYRPDILPVETPDVGPNDLAIGATDSRIAHLRRVPLFSDCTEQELRRIADVSRTVEARAVTPVTERGTSGDSFFFILDGHVSVVTPVGSGDPLRPGDFFGEMSLLDGEPRSATVTATTDVRLLVIDRIHFWRLLNETPDLVRRMLTVLSRRVRRLEKAVHTMGRHVNIT